MILLNLQFLTLTLLEDEKKIAPTLAEVKSSKIEFVIVILLLPGEKRKAADTSAVFVLLMKVQFSIKKLFPPYIRHTPDVLVK